MDRFDEKAKELLPCNYNCEFEEDDGEHHIGLTPCPAGYRTAVAAALRQCDEEARKPVEGTWGWALEQMKAGKRVTNSNTAGYYCFDYFESAASEPQHLALYTSNGSLCPVGLLIMPEDFDATDWQLVNAPATPPSTPPTQQE